MTTAQQSHRTLYLVEGIIFIILGLIAIAVPQIFTLGVELFIGWLLIIGGIVQLVRSFRSRHTRGFWAPLIGSIVSIVVGVLLLLYPVIGVLSLTLLLGIFFLLEGIMTIIWAFMIRPVQYWGMLLFSGIVSLILAGIIFFGWPSTAVWVIGLLVGINMLFFGISLLFLLGDNSTPTQE